MEAATWVIAGASIVNVIVLGLYAYITWGIWREMQTAGARTEDIARQSRETLKAQIVATLFQVEEAIKTRAIMPHYSADTPWPAIRGRRDEFERVFPVIWQEIEPILGPLPGEGKK